MKAKNLCQIWDIRAEHSLYRESGDWYHQLKRFPGALLDKDGYILFSSESEYKGCAHLQIKKDIHVPNRIVNIPGYKYFDKKNIIYRDKDIQSNKVKTYIEGETKSIILNKYERNNSARQACINYYGTVCVVCDGSLEEIYGPVAKDLVHVHHIIPIALIGKTYSINPIDDLRPVCPNCHSVIHKRTPPYSIEEVRELLIKYKK